MADERVTRRDLVDTVRSIGKVGDERWAGKAELPTQESVQGMVEAALGEAEGLTEEEVRAIFDEAQPADGAGGE